MYTVSMIFFFSWQKKILENNYFSPFNQYKFILLKGVQILLWFTVQERAEGDQHKREESNTLLPRTHLKMGSLALT